MKRIDKTLWSFLVAIFWLLTSQGFAQDVEVKLTSTRDAAGRPGDIVTVPILMDNDESSIIGDNIIALNLEFSCGSDLAPVSASIAGGLIDGWSHEFRFNESAKRWTLTAAGTTPIALDSGVLFYMDFELQEVAGVRNPTFSLYTSGDNYFNEGGYSFVMEYGQIKIEPLLPLNVSTSATKITVGDSTRISVSGGTEPYVRNTSDASLAEITSDEYLLALKPGHVQATAVDFRGARGESTVEIRGYRLGYAVSEESITPGDDIEMYITTTDLTDLEVLSGVFNIYFNNREGITFEEFFTEATLLEGTSMEVSAISDLEYSVAFASTVPLTEGDTLLGVRFNTAITSTGNFYGSFRDNILFNEDLPGNYTNSSAVSFIDAGTPSISFSNVALTPGETIQLNVSGGSEPYLWSVSDQEIASITEEGVLTAITGGDVTVSVEDAIGLTDIEKITLYDGRVEVAGHVVPVASNYLLPVYVSDLPNGREFVAFEIEFSYNSTQVKINDVATEGTLTEGFSIAVADVDGVSRTRVAGASSQEVGDEGILFYLDIDLLDLTEGQTSSIGIHQIKFNEGQPMVTNKAGFVKAGTPPTTGDVAIDVIEDEPYVLDASDFTFEHDDEMAEFIQVKFTSLPTVGQLLYNGSVVTVDGIFHTSILSNVTYQAIENENGTDYDAFEIKVSDGTNFSNHPATVAIHVESVNDSPMFNLTSETVELEEDFVDQEVVTLTLESVPTDEVDQTITYSMSPESVEFASVVFDDESLTVTISAVENGFGTQVFEISADDGQTTNNLFTKTLDLTITGVNDLPEIEDQTVSVEENRVTGTVITTLVGTDVDPDELSYSIVSGNTDDAFSLDATTGELTVDNGDAIDFETTPTFSLSVEVSDGSARASATVTINLTDVDEDSNQAPQINAQSFEIEENSANGVSIGTIIASDPDEDALVYAITDGNTDNAFLIEESTGALSVNNVEVLDFETTPVFELTVEVSDGELTASSTVTINLVDVDDTNDAPEMADQFITIEENRGVDFVVGTMMATDQENDALTFSLTGGNTDEAFAIDPASGEVVVKTSTSIDFEVNPVFSLAISVSDGEFSAEAILEITLVDVDESVNQSPQINAQSFEIEENSANAVLLGNIASFDPDGDALTYSVLDGNTSDAFAIHAASGELTVNNSAVLDFETTPIFTLTVQVSDGELNASASVTINLLDVRDTNDAPEISAQSFDLDENSANATAVGNVEASDPDGDALTYSITAGNTNDAFAIDGSSGALTVNNSAALDFETTPVFNLTVNVTDGELSAVGTITINLTDIDETVNQAPQINTQSFDLDENSANATAVGNVEASDPDGDALTYSISAGNTNDAFAIDGSSGALTVNNSAALDFETTPVFNLTVNVSDSELSADGSITINLTDIDESVNQAPQINAQNFDLDENSANATAVGNVVASDPDGDALTYSITAGNTDDAFAIDGSSGALTVNNSAALDFETTPNFVLTVEVSDSELTSSASISIHLIDVEDTNQSPEISDQSFTIDENSESNTQVGMVIATDADGDDLTYSITSGNDQGGFNINANTGRLAVANSDILDFETTPNFTLEVSVSDGTLSASATVSVALTDVDENVLGVQTLEFNVFPNPVDHQLTIEYPKPERIESIKLIGLSGNTVLSFDKLQTIDLREVSNGTYILELNVGKESIRSRILVRH